MKAITLWQPWASAIAFGFQTHETRSWSTEYRGLLAIHAAKTKKGIKLVEESHYIQTLFKTVVPVEDLPRGVIVAVVEVMDVTGTENVRYTTLAGTGTRMLNVSDYVLGDWSIGRFAWKLRLVKKVDPPIPARGQQGLWEWSE